jgi:hypothetical protein
MSADDAAPDRGSADDAARAAEGRADLVAQLRHLEAFAARAASEGDSLPPQATEMIAHLREIVQALDGLTASMAEQQARRDADAADAPGSRDVESA